MPFCDLYLIEHHNTSTPTTKVFGLGQMKGNLLLKSYCFCWRKNYLVFSTYQRNMCIFFWGRQLRTQARFQKWVIIREINARYFWEPTFDAKCPIPHCKPNLRKCLDYISGKQAETNPTGIFFNKSGDRLWGIPRLENMIKFGVVSFRVSSTNNPQRILGSDFEFVKWNWTPFSLSIKLIFSIFSFPRVGKGKRK